MKLEQFMFVVALSSLLLVPIFFSSASKSPTRRVDHREEIARLKAELHRIQEMLES